MRFKNCIFVLTVLATQINCELYVFDNATVDAYRDRNRENRIDFSKFEEEKLQDSVQIDITGNVTILHPGSIKNLLKLEGIILDDCRITEIKPGAFENLPALVYVSLENNLIRKISEGVFNNLPVHSIYLTRNNISEIAAKALDNLPKLKSIYLNDNKLPEWNSEWFARGTNEVSFVNMEGNLLKKIGSKAFKNLQGTHEEDDGLECTSLIFSRNKIEEIAVDAFDGLGSLGDLFLDENKLETLGEDVFKSLTMIMKVNLDGNKLSCIPNSLLGIVSSIKSVEYKTNPITKDCETKIRSKMS